MKVVVCTRRLFPCAKRSVYHKLKEFYQKIGINDIDEIKRKAYTTKRFLDHEERQMLKIGNKFYYGKKTPIAMLKSDDEETPVIVNGKPYTRDCGDWVILVQVGTKAHLVVEHTNLFAPYNWGTEDDYFCSPNTYVMFTDDRIKDVFDTLN